MAREGECTFGKRLSRSFAVKLPPSIRRMPPFELPPVPLLPALAPPIGEDRSVALDFVRQFVFIVRVAREMPRENFAHALDCQDDRFGKPAVLQSGGHSPGNFLPEFFAAFFVHFHIAPEGKLVGQRRKVNQHGVPMTSARHAELRKPGLRRHQCILSLPVRNINANLAGGLALGLGNRSHDFTVVELINEFFRFHAFLPTATGTATTETAATTGKPASRETAAAKAAASSPTPTT